MYHEVLEGELTGALKGGGGGSLVQWSVSKGISMNTTPLSSKKRRKGTCSHA